MSRYEFCIIETRMGRLTTIVLGILTGVVIFFIYDSFFTPTIEYVEISKVPVHVGRIGIDLGKWSPWGAAQYMSNVLFNPGFEAGISRAVIRVEKSEDKGFFGKEHYGDHFWDGAQFEVLTGKARGQKGKVVSNNFTSFSLDLAIPLEKGDSLVFTKVENESVPINWQVPEQVRHLVGVDPHQARPNSPGTQSALLLLQKGETPILFFEWDDLSQSAGNMLPIDGTWELRFWGKGDRQLKTSFHRSSLIFLEKIVNLENEWKEYRFTFEGKDANRFGKLLLQFEGIGETGKIWIDDVTLTQKGENSSFSHRVTTLCNTLKPGILRNWQGQLGQTFANSTLSPFGRHPLRYQMGKGHFAYDFLYGLDDFLFLCQEVEAIPWIILPPAYTQEELEAFAHHIKDHTMFHVESWDKKCCYIEFGNDLENPGFQLGVPEKVREREEFAFSIISKIMPQAVLISSLNQVVYPFFLKKLEVDTVDTEAFSEMFKPYSIKVRGKYIGETNLGTLWGTATPEQRNRLVASKIAGHALAHHILQAWRENAQAVCVFKLAGYEYDDTKPNLDPLKPHVHLFGIARDLERLRPQGIIVEALNKIVVDEYYPIINKADLEGGLFVKDGKASIVVSSSNNRERTVILNIPDNMKNPTKLIQLSGELLSSNEEGEEVSWVEQKIEIDGNEAQIVIPPYGLMILN